MKPLKVRKTDVKPIEAVPLDKLVGGVYGKDGIKELKEGEKDG